MTTIPMHDDPVEILDACHARIRAAAALMRKLIRCYGEAEGGDKARQAATHLLQFFELAAQQHQQDEEQDVYPMLVAAAPRMMRPEVETLVRELFAGHRQISALWHRLRPQLTALTRGAPVCLDVALIRRLSVTYEAHLKREEDICFPLMLQLFDPRQLLALGMRIAARRGAHSDAVSQPSTLGRPGYAAATGPAA